MLTALCCIYRDNDGREINNVFCWTGGVVWGAKSDGTFVRTWEFVDRKKDKHNQQPLLLIIFLHRRQTTFQIRRKVLFAVAFILSFAGALFECLPVNCSPWQSESWMINVNWRGWAVIDNGSEGRRRRDQNGEWLRAARFPLKDWQLHVSGSVQSSRNPYSQ